MALSSSQGQREVSTTPLHKLTLTGYYKKRRAKAADG